MLGLKCLAKGILTDNIRTNFFKEYVNEGDKPHYVRVPKLATSEKVLEYIKQEVESNPDRNVFYSNSYQKQYFIYSYGLDEQAKKGKTYSIVSPSGREKQSKDFDALIKYINKRGSSFIEEIKILVDGVEQKVKLCRKDLEGYPISVPENWRLEETYRLYVYKVDRNL